VSPLSRQLFSALERPRENYKSIQNHLEMSFLDMFLKIMYNVRFRNGNEKPRLFQDLFLNRTDIIKDKKKNRK
jgi:hypothetical protein